MVADELQGTPTVLLVDLDGRLRKQAFGRPSDLALGGVIMALGAETRLEQPIEGNEPNGDLSCDADSCAV